MSGAQIQAQVGSFPWFEPLHHRIGRQPLLPMAISAIAGVGIDASVRTHDAACWFAGVWIMLLVLAVAVAVASRRSCWRATATILVFLPLAAWLHARAEACYQDAFLLRVADAREQPAILEGMVDAPVQLRRHPLANQAQRVGRSPWQTHVEVVAERIQIGRDFRPCDGRVLVVVDQRRDELLPGDRVRTYGRMRAITAPTNPGQRDLRDVYKRRRIHARMYVDSAAQIATIGDPVGALEHLGRPIASFAAASRNILLQHIDERLGPLAVALVLGQRDLIDDQTRDQLLVTGTAHLLSVSGLHLAIVVLMAHWMAVLLRMPGTVRFLWIIAICFLYTAVTGGRPPVVRASVLVATWLLATLIKRPAQPLNSLSLAAIILIVVNPPVAYSVGVQLSFLAVTTLLLCGRPFDSRDAGTARISAIQQAIRREDRLDALIADSRSKPIRYFRYATATVWQAVWISGCVTVISLPLIWYQFHVVSPISIGTNVLLGPMLVVALSAGVTTALVGAVHESLAIIPGAICQWTLYVMQWLIESAASIPGGHYWLPSPPKWSIGLYYAVLAGTLGLRPARLVSLARYVWIAIWLAGAVISATTKPALPSGTLEATFVDVGHGTSVVLRFSTHDVWLYDCGWLGNDRGSSRDIDATLWSLGVTRLRGVFLSHADADHFNALPGLLERFKVDRVLTPRGMLAEPEPALRSVRAAIARSGVPVSEVGAAAVLWTAGIRIRVLHPPHNRVDGSDNANSLVLRIDCHGTSLTLPGDLEPPGTARVIATPRPPPGGVLMAPHHGSLQLDASAVLQWARPSETIVSGGPRARRVEVRDLLAASGSGVHVTSDLGAIRVVIDRNGKIELRSWSQSPW